jgi:3'-phosphoadenosine 5'-phosphosulfate sulfotransferase (PAPS reductase)/FAD synthetase
MDNKKVICWWSGGITSAVACKIAIDIYGLDNCRIIMMDTGNEDDDTYRFKRDCESWYGKSIEIITALGTNYGSIQDVWRRFNSLNVATGAICSATLKRDLRKKWQQDNEYDYQVFGFEFDKKEMNRAISMKKNYPNSSGIYPLLMLGYDKDDCAKVLSEAGIEIPRVYRFGFRNNNCFKTGCVQGGIGYWQKMKRDFPDKFDEMAQLEHELTDRRGEPVTMLKDQSKEAKSLVDQTGIKWKCLIFLKKHPMYPELKSIDEMKDRDVEPLFECNGFCSINDLNPKSSTDSEINFDTNL